MRQAADVVTAVDREQLILGERDLRNVCAGRIRHRERHRIARAADRVVVDRRRERGCQRERREHEIGDGTGRLEVVRTAEHDDGEGEGAHA